MSRRLHRHDEGSGTVVAMGMLASVVLLITLANAVSVTVLAHARAAAAADAAALAAADTASGREPGVPCEMASRVAAEHGASLSACRLDGLIATVVTTVRAPLLPAVARATAGPPG